MKRCLNCGFVFIHPNYKGVMTPFGESKLVPVCPKCGSDALVEE